jgi:hypothetical protein
MVCSHCRESLAAHDVAVEPGPGLPSGHELLDLAVGKG